MGGRFAQKLAVRAIAEAEFIVPGLRSGVVRPCRDCLRLERFDGSVEGHFGRDHGCDGDFKIHAYDGNQFMIAGADGQGAVKFPFDFPGDAEPKVGG